MGELTTQVRGFSRLLGDTFLTEPKDIEDDYARVVENYIDEQDPDPEVRYFGDVPTIYSLVQGIFYEQYPEVGVHFLKKNDPEFYAEQVDFYGSEEEFIFSQQEFYEYNYYMFNGFPPASHEYLFLVDMDFFLKQTRMVMFDTHFDFIEGEFIDKKPVMRNPPVKTCW